MTMDTLSVARRRWWKEALQVMSFAVPALIVATTFMAWLIGPLGHFLLEAYTGEYDIYAWQVTFIGLPFWMRALYFLPFGIVLLGIAVVCCNGSYPSEESVERRNAMRRAYGERE